MDPPSGRIDAPANQILGSEEPILSGSLSRPTQSQYSRGGRVDTVEKRLHLIMVNRNYRDFICPIYRWEMASPFYEIGAPAQQISG